MRFSARSNPTPLLVRASSVLTLSEQQRNPAAFLVEDGMVKRLINSHRKAKQLAEGQNVRTLDRPECCILPGFSDAHVHMKWLGESLREPDLSSCSSFEQIRSHLVEWIRDRTLSEGELIHGRGWNPNRLDEQRWPRCSDLNHPEISGHPVALASHDHHAYWVNETAIKKILQKDFNSSPSGGKIVRDENGNPSGVFVEHAIEPVKEFIERKREDRRTTALLVEAAEELVRNGITCVHDFGHYESLEAHIQIRTSKDLFPEVCFFCFHGSWDKIPSQHRSPGSIVDGLEFAGLKLFADGTLGAQTAAMLDPYEEQLDGTSTRGELVCDKVELAERARRAASQRFSTAIHAIGDRAVRISLDVLSDVYDTTSELPYSPRIEHAQFVSKQDLNRFQSNGIIASMQPCHLFQDRSTAETTLGTRAEGMFPIRSLLKRRTSVLFGSDAPVEPVDPLRNVQAAVHRCRNGVSPSGPDEAISRSEALKFSCLTPVSYLNHTPNRGMIKPGLPANFIVLSDNPLTCERGPLTDLRVLETFVNGQSVYSS